MPDTYLRRTESLVIVKGTQVTSRVCEGGKLASKYHFAVQRNTLHLQAMSSQDDVNLTISYRLLYKLGGVVKEIQGATQLRTGAYTAAVDGILSYPIQVTNGANEVEVTVTSASDVTGYLEGLWVDAQGGVGAERLIYTNQTQPAGAPGVAASGGQESITIYAPVGYVSKLLSVYLYVPAPVGATSGEHILSVAIGPVNITQAKSGHTSVLQYVFSHWSQATTKYPPDAMSQAFALRGVEFDSAQPLKTIYVNNTDAANQTERFYRFISIDRRVA